MGSPALLAGGESREVDVAVRLRRGAVPSCSYPQPVKQRLLPTLSRSVSGASRHSRASGQALPWPRRRGESSYEGPIILIPMTTAKPSATERSERDGSASGHGRASYRATGVLKAGVAAARTLAFRSTSLTHTRA